MFKFIRLLKSQAQDRDGTSTEDVNLALAHLIRVSQTTLQRNRQFPEWKRQFGLFKDATGVWRCRGRLANADVPLNARFPTLLDKGEPLTRLIVMDCHEKVKHGGVNSTLAELRSSYWVVQGRQLVKKLLHDCIICRRYQGRPYTAPTPPLPRPRVKEAPPFSYTGIDFAGPLYTRETLASSTRKVWMCLYTCCIVRAVHLDIVTDLTSQAFLRSFRRFTSRRGIPMRVLSDNGKTFTAAAKSVASILRHPDVQRHFLDVRVCWQFNVEKAPWWGGVFERMIQSAKRCLRKVIGNSQLTYEELLTAVIEVEAMLNSRPLTYLAPDDLDEPLTPSHLLTGRRILSLPDLPIGNEEDYLPQPSQDELTRRMNHLNRILEHFWTRWKREYLLELRNAHRYHGSSQRTADSPIAVGDIVIIHDENQPRGLWRMGRVDSLMRGKDGKVRAASVKTRAKDGKPIILRRPVQRLYPLETPINRGNMEKHESTPNEEAIQVKNPEKGSTAKTARPKRQSTVRA